MKSAELEYSLFNCLDNFWQSLPDTLVDSDQLTLLKDRATFFPPILRVGIECRMNQESQVDLQQCLLRGVDDLHYLSSWFKHQSINDDKDWNSLSRFILNWSNPSSHYHNEIDEVFLEMDVLPGNKRIPLLFFTLDLEDKKNIKSTLFKILRETLGESRSFYPILERCFTSCPENATVFFTGIHFSRNIDAIRINIKSLYSQQVIPFLTDLGYTQFAPEFENWINFVYSHSDRVRVCIDLGETVFPKIGFECFWDNQPTSDPRWVAFLNDLVSKNICLREKADAVLSWEQDIFPHPTIKWPEHLWVQSINKSKDEFTYLKRKISHLKLSIDPLNPPELKAYLGYGNLWLNMNQTVRENKVDNHLTLSEKTIGQSIDQGLTFMLSSQNQSGAWIDFQLPPGKSDEWITAYIGYHLSFFENTIIEKSLNRAWDFLKKRYRPKTGWGYNSITPADSDSTLWAYLFSTQIPRSNSSQYKPLLEQYQLPDGGLTTYLAVDEIRKNTKLGKGASFKGWQSLHLCVTAAHALSGNKKALNSVINNQNQDGSITAYWWEGDEYSTALAAEAMALNYATNEKELKKAFDWSFNRLSQILVSSTKSIFNISFLIRTLLLAQDLTPYIDVLNKGAALLLTSQQNNGCWAPSAALRVPMPSTVNPMERESNWVVMDQNCLFTSVTVLYTLQKINKRLYEF